MSAARPLCGVIGSDGKVGEVAMPSVLLAPIRPDIVHFVHSSMNKNKRQAYSVSQTAGHQHSAESWGTGRAVARIPRVSGGGTSRAGQAAFGNMCRSGRMFGQTKTWRKWHRKINTNQKRYAVASALAASALTSLVMARGHKIADVPEIPLVVPTEVESTQKTKEAIACLKSLGAYADVEKAKASRKLRRGKGKMRNRRHVQRRGPLVVYAEDNGITQAFRNLPGVELCDVTALNLLQLAPGGHVGRFIIWTQAAFEKLESIWGTVEKGSSDKVGYSLPRNIVSNSDITRIINSDEVQSKVRPADTLVVRSRRKKNPLKNYGVLVKLNPYSAVLRKAEHDRQAARATKGEEMVAARRKSRADARKAHTGKAKTANYQRMARD